VKGAVFPLVPLPLLLLLLIPPPLFSCCPSSPCPLLLLPLIPPTPFSHKGRRGRLGVLMSETRAGAG